MPDDTPRAPSFIQVTIRLPLDPPTRRAALRAFKTKQGIEKAILVVAKNWRKKYSDAAIEFEAKQAADKKAAAEKRKADAAARKAKKRQEKIDRHRQALEKLEADQEAAENMGAKAGGLAGSLAPEADDA